MAGEKRVLRIAVIANDLVSEKESCGRGQYIDMFRNLFQNATRTGQVPAVAVELENFKAYESQLPSAQHVAENFDAVLLTGSVSDIWEMDRKIWIRKLLDWIRELQAYNEGQPTEKKIRMLGSCFGHQAINAALGGTVEPNPKGYENGLVDVAFTDEGKKFFGGVGMKVAEAEEDGLGVMQVHGAAVTKSAPGLETLAYTEITAHQSTRLADSDGSTLIFTCQWHPEFQTPVVGAIIDLIRTHAVESRYPTSQYQKEKDSVTGVADDAPGSIATGIKMLQVAAGAV